MLSSRSLTIPASFFRLQARFGDAVFSPSEAEPLLGKGITTYLELSRLARIGWLFRVGRGRYAVVDPLVRLTPGALENLRPFRSNCYYPIIYRVTGEILRRFSGRLRGIALFGSTARGTSGPESDLDILVLLTRRAASVGEEVRGRIGIADSSAPLLLNEYDRVGHWHSIHVLPVAQGDFAHPGPVLLDLPEEARIIYDPDASLRSHLRQLSILLRRRGARKVHPRGEKPYWELGTIMDATA